MTRIADAVIGQFSMLYTIPAAPLQGARRICSPGVGASASAPCFPANAGSSAPTGRANQGIKPRTPQADSSADHLRELWDKVKIGDQIIDDLNEIDRVLSSEELSEKDAAKANNLVAEVNVLMPAFRRAFDQFEVAAKDYFAAGISGQNAVEIAERKLQELRKAVDTFLDDAKFAVAGKTKFVNPQEMTDPVEDVGKKTVEFRKAWAALMAIEDGGQPLQQKSEK